MLGVLVVRDTAREKLLVGCAQDLDAEIVVSEYILSMAGARPPVPPVSLSDNEVLMEDMALYAEKIDLQSMMQEYLRRLTR